jgi:RNA polymerase sigma factor (sigma-70 family)
MLLEHEPRIRTMAARFCGRGVNLEDLRQEGRAALIYAIRRFDETRGVRLWTYAQGFVLDAIMTFHKKERREPSRDDPKARCASIRGEFSACPAETLDLPTGGVEEDDNEDRSPVGRLPSRTLAPDDDLARAQTLGSLRDALPALTEIERKVFDLRFVDGLEVRDLAEIVGLSKSTAHDHLTRGLAKLRASLAEAA